MRSKTTKRFWRYFEALPDDIKRHAKRSHTQWRLDPYYPGLQFKKVSDNEPLYSVRIGMHYRALGLREGDVITWFWIGTHADYDGLL